MTNEEYEYLVDLLIGAISDIDSKPPELESAKTKIKTVGELLTLKWSAQL